MHGSRSASLLWPAFLLAGTVPAGAGPETQDLAWTLAEVDAAGVVAHVVSAITAWANEGYRKNPAVMLGLLALVVLPMLAPIGLLLRRSGRADSGPRNVPEPHEPPLRALWIEIEGVAASRRGLNHEMVRIGRQDDNDLRINDATVHRYHAILCPSPEGGLMIVDVGGRDGNGIRINGERVTQAPLKPGDRLHVGRVPLRIGAAEYEQL